MKIVMKPDDKMRRDELLFIFHPKNIMLIKTMKELLDARLGEIEVKDEYNNHLFIVLLDIYYIEIIDHKVFVYTQQEVYRYYQPFQQLKDYCLKVGFHQINVRTFVNERHVQKYVVKKHCHRELILDNDEVLIANRRFKDEVDRFIRNRNIPYQEI